jgi:glycosyltransferase involved in cell wall biosynthesis
MEQIQSTRTAEDYKKSLLQPCRPQGGLKISRNFRKISTPNRPLVTIITVVFNGKKYLEQTIMSVLNQTYDHIEYVIIDGGSTDGTLDIIHKYEEQIDYWRSEPDEGIYDAMNKGIAASSGILVNLLNADDYFELDAVKLVVDKYLKYDLPCIIYGDAYYVDETYSMKARFYSTLHNWLGMTANHQAMFVHRDIYTAVGLYDPRYKLSGDYDFFIRSAEKNVYYLKLNDSIANCRNDGSTLLYASKSREEANVINKNYYGSFSIKRFAFLVFNYLWMPLKLNLRTALYKTIGVTLSRRLIAVYKKIIHRG